MRRCFRVWALGALPLVGACGTSTDRTTLVSIEAPHAAELAHVHEHGVELACAGGHGFGLCFPESVDNHHVELQVQGPRARTARISCGHEADAFELVWSPQGDRIAARCGETWRVVYLPGETAVFDVAAPEGFGPDPDGWSAVPAFAEAAAELWETRAPWVVVQALAAEVDESTALDLMTDKCAAGAVERWQRTLVSLDEPWRRKAYGAVRERMLEQLTDGSELACLAGYPGAWFEPSPAETKRTRAALEDTTRAVAVQRWLLFELWRTPVGPEAGCAWIGRQKPGSWRDVDAASIDLALHAVMRGEGACPAVSDFLEPPCSELFTRVDEQGNVAAFTPEQIDGEVASSAQFYGRREVGPLDKPSAHLIVAALRGRSGDPDASSRRLDRLTYEASSTHARCNASMARETACSLSPNAAEGEVGDCRVVVDDDARTITAADPGAVDPPSAQ